MLRAHEFPFGDRLWTNHGAQADRQWSKVSASFPLRPTSPDQQPWTNMHTKTNRFEYEWPGTLDNLAEKNRRSRSGHQSPHPPPPTKSRSKASNLASIRLLQVTLTC